MENWVNYRDMERIFIPSIMHTGTIFIRNLITQSCYRYFIAYLWQRPEYIEIINNQLTGRVYAAYNCDELFNIFNTGYFEMAAGVNLYGENLGILACHFGDPVEAFIPQKNIKEIIKAFPTIIPLRDPLKAILSRYKRNPDHENMDCSFIVNGFCFLAELDSENIPFGILPIDLHAEDSKAERIEAIKKLFEYIGIYTGIYSDLYIYEQAEFNVLNPSKPPIDFEGTMKEEMTKFQRCITEDDLKVIKEAIPNDYKYLKSKESIIRPFLEKVGYNNLLWWE